jgi:dienelactone hydrolase
VGERAGGGTLLDVDCALTACVRSNFLANPRPAPLKSANGYAGASPIIAGNSMYLLKRSFRPGVCLAALCLAAGPAASLSAQSQPQGVPRLSSEVMAAAPLLQGPRISPDGTHLLAEMSIDGKVSLGVADLGGSGLELVPIPEEEDLRTYAWAGNHRIIFSVGAKIPWYDRGEHYVTRAFSYDLETQQAMPVGPKIQGMNGDDILWIDPKGESLLLATQTDQRHYPSIFRVDLSNGKAKIEQRPHDYVWDWYADRYGVVRYGLGYKEFSWFYLYRSGPDDNFSASDSVDYDTQDSPDALGFEIGSDEGYALSKKSGRFALYKYDFTTHQLGDPVYENPTNDVASFSLNQRTNELTALAYIDDRPRIKWFDPNLQAVQDKLNGTFGGKDVYIISRDHENDRMVVRVEGPTDPGAYYLYTVATGGLARLAKMAEGVDHTGLSETRYVHYTARDGLDIPALLTLPVGRDPKDLPLIIYPHGGPYGIRDSLGYNPEVQFLANRGYVVLQPNYRGSDGYGEAFYAKGEGQWGRAMQDDIDDGMDWLAKQGIVDPKRVCIVGGSYGGYVAAWGATRNPERYRCAVSFAGVTDLAEQLDYQSDFLTGTRWRKDWQNTVRGDKDFDLDSVSPLKQVARLKVPIMLVHGSADTTVLPQQSTAYDKALTAAGKVHETYIYPGEGHGFDRSKDEKDYLDKLEAFLTKYNPA